MGAAPRKALSPLDALHAAMMQALAEAKKEERSPWRAHPETAGAEASRAC
jgi:2-oxo-4-hydroxy-4-carboxy--5-ureidoimidazoline (OHCU) decarboxylase